MLHIIMYAKSKKQKGLTFLNYKLRSVPLKGPPPKKKFRLAMDPQEDNPVYSQLKQDRNNKHIFQFLLSSAFGSEGPKQRTLSEHFNRHRAYSPNFKVFSKHQHNQTCKEIETLRTQGLSIFEEADEMGVYLRQKKKKIEILKQYNQAVDRYCKFIPKNYEQNEKELLFAHQEIKRLCTEDLFPKKDNLAMRAASFRHYKEPNINAKHFQRNRVHRRTKTLGFEEGEPSLALRNHTLHL